jgi:hypothetical protein
MTTVPTTHVICTCVTFLAVKAGSYNFGAHAQAEHSNGSLYYLKIMANQSKVNRRDRYVYFTEFSTQYGSWNDPDVLRNVACSVVTEVGMYVGT